MVRSFSDLIKTFQENPGAGPEMAQSVDCLLHRNKDPSLEPDIYVVVFFFFLRKKKPVVGMCPCNSSTGKVKTEESQEPADQLVLSNC